MRKNFGAKPYLYPMPVFIEKFLLRFFQKADGAWGGAPRIGVSFLELFSCACGVKEKSVEQLR